MKTFWEVIYLDEENKWELLGKSHNYTLLTNDVADMQMAGLMVRCQTIDREVSKNEQILPDYVQEDSL